ncbi:MAG: hypothetical protein LUC26_05605 [Prevotella sp.]|nr:hypothetical protein [Prevotella sp.]
MRNLINLKWLMATILLCTPMFTWAQDEGDAEGTTTKSYELHIDDYPWNYTAAASGSITINYDSDNAWGEFKLTDGSAVDLSVYKGCKIVYTDASDVQIMIKYADSENGDKYQDLSGSGTFEYTFETDYGNVTTFELQGKAVNAAVSVSEAYLIKQDDTQEAMVYGGPSWGCTYIAHSLPAITFTGQYGSVYLLDSETEEPATFTYGEGNSMAFTITFSEATTGALVVEADGTDSNNPNYWYNIDTGSTTATFTIDDSAVSADVAKIYIKSNNDNDADYSEESGGYTSYATPYTIHFTSITAEVTTASNGDEEENGGDDDVNGSATSSYIQYAEEGSDDQDCLLLNGTTVGTSDNSTDNSTITVGEDNTSATLTFSGTYTSMGWEYSAEDEYLDVSKYNQMVVYYTVTPEDNAKWKSAYNVSLILEDSNGKTDTIAAHTATGIVRWTVSSQTITPSSIKYVKIYTDAACTINVKYIQLIDSNEASAETGLTHDLLYPSLSVWSGSGYDTEDTFAPDTEITLDEDNNCVIETKASYIGCNWYFDPSGTVDEDEYWGVRLKVKTDGEYLVKIYIEYQRTTDNWDWVTETFSIMGKGDNSTEQTLILPFIKSTDEIADGYDDHNLIKINIMWGAVDQTNGSKITITEAKLLGANYFASEENGGYTDRAIIVTSEHAAGYGTYYNSKAIITPLGMEAGSISGISKVTTDEEKDVENIDDGVESEEEEDTSSPFVYELTPNYIYKNTRETETSGDVIPGGTPLFIFGEAGAYDGSELTFTAFYAPESAEEGTKPTSNWLHGKDDKATSTEMESITAEDNNDSEDDPVDYIYYKLSYQNSSYQNLGFYWGTDGGGAFNMEKAHKCWLAIPQSEITKLNGDDEDEGDGTSKLFGGLSIGDGSDDADIDNNIDENVVGSDEGETTGITSVSTAAGSDAIYTIQGVRVGSMSQKGVYIVNGRKVINK